MRLKPRHRWFSHTDKTACDGWSGPHDTIEDAVDRCDDECGVDASIPVYVAQGRKLRKDELGDMDVDFTWEVDTRNCFEIKVLKEVPRAIS